MKRENRPQTTHAMTSLIRQHTGHEWKACAPREDAGLNRQPGTTTVWPWRCALCGAYAESEGQPLLIVDLSIRLPGPEDLRRWGVADDCETESVEKVHGL